MDLIVQGADVETVALKEIAKAVGASGIGQVRPNVFRLRAAKPAAGIAELCARHGVECIFEESQ